MKIQDKKKYCEEVLKIKLDRWQNAVLDEEEKNITIRAGRQVGKSTIIGLKVFFYAIEHTDKTILVVAASQRQSGLLFEKIKSFFVEYSPELIKEDPTMTKLILTNGCKIYALPAGRSGYTIRGYSIDLLIADEAAYIAEPVWIALIPMLAVTKGKLILLSTPFGKGGYFFDSFGDIDFKQFHLSSEDCPRIPKTFLLKEKGRMTKMEYAQEYLGEFIEEFSQLFPTALIKKCVKFEEWNYKINFNKTLKYYLGVDVARYGGDENAFCIAELQREGKTIKIVKIVTTTRISTTDTIGRIQELDELFNFKRIFIDDAGVGGGVTDVCIEKLGKAKVVGLNNASKRVQVQGEEKNRGILKEDLYSNVLIMMEQDKIELINDPSLLRSLKSVEFEYTADRGTRHLTIKGKYMHIAEALVRACWCMKEKGLNLFIM
jgi:hypothetical protein